MPGWLVYLPLAFSRSPSFGPWPGFLATPRSLPQTDLPLHPAFPSMPATQPLSFPVVSVIWERQDKWSLFAGERLSVINKENQDLARACVCVHLRIGRQPFSEAVAGAPGVLRKLLLSIEGRGVRSFLNSRLTSPALPAFGLASSPIAWVISVLIMVKDQF